MTFKTADISMQHGGGRAITEHMVLALEEMAERLQALALANRQDLNRESGAAADCARLDNWENEGGTIGRDAGLAQGIQRLHQDIFVVGPYRYTRLDDALAQLGRSAAHSKV